MEIINYFDVDDKIFWKEEIGKSDWGAEQQSITGSVWKLNKSSYACRRKNTYFFLYFSRTG